MINASTCTWGFLLHFSSAEIRVFSWLSSSLVLIESQKPDSSHSSDTSILRAYTVHNIISTLYCVGQSPFGARLGVWAIIII